MFKRWLMYKYYSTIESLPGRIFVIIILIFAIGLLGSAIFIILGLGKLPFGGIAILIGSIVASIKLTALPKTYNKDDYDEFWD